MKAADWDAKYGDHELVWGKEPNQFVRQQCERLPVGRALDLACGEGRNAIWLARLGWSVHGWDFSKVAIERARALAEREPESVQEQVSWDVADLTTTAFPKRKYDLVLISYLHLGPDHWDAVMTGAAGAVSSGGRLLLVAHDRRNLTEGVGGPQDETVLATPEQVAASMQRSGLTVKLAETVERQTPEGVALDTLALGMRLTGFVSSSDVR